MVTVELGGIARDTFMLFDAQGDPVNADVVSPVEPRVASVTLNNGNGNSLIFPTIVQAVANGAQVGQYEVEFPVTYSGAAAGDIIVVRVVATISPGMKVKENIVKFLVDPGAPAEPFIDVT